MAGSFLGFSIHPSDEAVRSTTNSNNTMNGWLEAKDKSDIKWKVNWDGVTQTVRSYYAAMHIAQSMKVETLQESVGFFDKMTVQNIVTDWDNVRKRTQTALSAKQSKWRNNTFRDFSEMHKDLVAMRREARRYQSSNNRFLRGIIESNTRETKRHIESLDATIKALQWVRDLSTTTLVVGSGFISGGASLAVLGGGSALTGVGRYQDTGNIGAAVVDATGTFVLGSFTLRGVKGPLAAMPQASKKAFFWLVEMPISAVVDMSTDILEGKSLSESGLDFGLKSAGEFLLDTAAQGLLKRLPMPVRKKLRYMPYNLRIPMYATMDVLKSKGIDATSEKLLSVYDTKSPKSLVLSAHQVPNQPPDDDVCYVNSFALFRS